MVRVSAAVCRVMDGELKGADQHGNQYYENLQRPAGRQRFIIYRGWGRDVDPSQIPAEWHHWLHSITDRTPVERPVKPHRWQLSATAQQLSGHGMEGRYAPPGSYVRTEPKQHTSYNVWEKESVKDTDNSGTQPRA